VRNQPKLIPVTVPRRPVAVALVLHGGASRAGSPMVSPTQLSVLRMIPIARRIARLGADRLAVFRLLNSTRGWDARHTPADDARWALDRAAEQLGERLPACLVGHSLGGRAALLCAGEHGVHSVAALAPWLEASERLDVPPGCQILIIHGSRDRIASPARSAALAGRLSGRARVSYVSVAGGKHAMLRRHRVFDRLAAEFAVATLLDQPTSDTIARVLAGDSSMEV
jgi:pimeloyl-ACP methyl ester carboxylesterase